MKGRLIVIESGSDASGKATQSRLLVEALTEKGVMVKGITFPNYDSPSSGPVKMYLAGEFGGKADGINAYAASVLYSVDRFASYAKDWKTHMENGGIVVADRYTTSNMVHQASKIVDQVEREAYLAWLEDLEYEKMGLPRPDLVIFLDVPIAVSSGLIAARSNKIDGSSTHDIHESDQDYLEKCYQNSLWVAENRGWKRIVCTDENNKLRSIEDIHAEILNAVVKTLSL